LCLDVVRPQSSSAAFVGSQIDEICGVHPRRHATWRAVRPSIPAVN